MIQNSRQILYSANFFGREKYSFLTQHYEKMMPEPVQSLPNACGFYTIYAASHLFKFRHEEFTGVNDVNVISFTSKYMLHFNLFNANVQAIQWVCYYLRLVYTMCLLIFIHPNYRLSSITQSFYIPLSQFSIRTRGRKWLTVPCMVDSSFYGWSFLLWSFHIWYIVISNTY